MKLFLVHCGFYDPDLEGGLYENHTNFMICAKDWQEAKQRVKQMTSFKKRKMHIDGLMEIEAVEGYRIRCDKDSELGGKTRLSQLKYGSRVPKTIELD